MIIPIGKLCHGNVKKSMVLYRAGTSCVMTDLAGSTEGTTNFSQKNKKNRILLISKNGAPGGI